jgi:hypothetical protein
VGRVDAKASAQFSVAPDRVLEFLRDYRDSRPRILTDNWTAYRVEQGGRGEGTVYRMHVSERSGRLEEQDQGSTFVSTWSVEPSPPGSTVTIESSWQGATGIGGFFEARFAPRGLQRIYLQVLAALQVELAG